VNGKPKRRWYQFSLKMLLVAVTLLAVPLARIAYLHQRAIFHENEARRLWEKWGNDHPLTQTTRIPEIFSYLGSDDLTESAKHSVRAKRYRDAVYRPWKLVDESDLDSAPASNPPKD
jgi:hypothetical protein